MTGNIGPSFDPARIDAIRASLNKSSPARPSAPLGGSPAKPTSSGRPLWVQAATIIVAFTVLLYAIEVVDVLVNHRLDRAGVEPRQVDGLWGILFAPVLHFGWAHLIANTIPMLVLGFLSLMAGIARGIALNPKVLICDEPVSALDVSVQAQVINLMEKLQDELGLSYIFIAHDLSVVRHISDRVGVMYLGRMVEIGDEDDIYSRPTHPYTQALLSAVPVPDPTLRGKREQIVLQGDVPSPANPPAGCHFHTRCWKAQDICRTETPLLELRTDGSGEHPSRCHFAEPRVIVDTQVVTEEHGLFAGQGLVDRTDAVSAGQAGAVEGGASADTSTAGAFTDDPFGA